MILSHDVYLVKSRQNISKLTFLLSWIFSASKVEQHKKWERNSLFSPMDGLGENKIGVNQFSFNFTNFSTGYNFRVYVMFNIRFGWLQIKIIQLQIYFNLIIWSNLTVPEKMAPLHFILTWTMYNN